MKLTLISIKHKGKRYSGFIYMKPNTKLSENFIEKNLKHIIPYGTTYTPGG